MKRGRVLTIVIAAAVAIAAGGVVVSFLPTDSGTHVAQKALGDSPGHTGTAPGRPVLPSGPPQSPGGDTGDNGGKNGTKQDNSLIEGTVNGGSEQIPTATPTPYRLHPSPVPSALSADDLRAAPASKGTKRSVSSAHGTTQIFLSGTTSTAPTETVAFYQSAFTALGMTGKPIAAVGGSTAIAFTKGASTVTLTVSAHEKGSSYTVHGVLRTGA